jgi:hypothetical protein
MPARRPKMTAQRKTAFVPRGLFLGALASTSVIPLVACGGSVAQPVQTVAACAFDGDPCPSVARGAFEAGPGDGGVAEGSTQDTGITFTVAACAFDGSCEPPPDASLGVADVAFKDATLGVADGAFGVADGAFGVAIDAFTPDVIFTVGACAFDGGCEEPDGGLHIGVPPVAFNGRK